MLLATAGCAQTGPRYGSSGAGLPISGGSSAAPTIDEPAWASLPHSWSKLTAIEAWLERTAPASGRTRSNAASGTLDGWRREGTLQLAEGKLAFAGRGKAADRILEFRRSAAREGFETVLRDRGASSKQVSRAKRGLSSLEGLRAAAGAAPNLRTQGAMEASASIGGLVKRSAWSARPAARGNMTPATAPWRWITVHHSVFRPDSEALGDSLACVRSIQRNHMQNNGWGDLGYHFLIDRAGRVIEGRQLVWQGAHAGGTNNRGNVGICLLGNFEEEYPARAQLASLNRLVMELQSKLKVPRQNVRPHRAWGTTDCPGRHLMPWFTRS